MIRIEPLDQLNCKHLNIENVLKELLPYSEKCNLHEHLGNYEIFGSGTDAIRYIIEKEKINIGDEVFITTTTNSSYVSTCVSATIFNYCKISRLITEKTKAIFVIHTFCFPHPELETLRKIADERNIILIEDCIAAFDSFNSQNIRLGSVGDYAVYSLRKIFPIKYGGILHSKKNNIAGIKDNYLHQEIKLWEPFLSILKTRRRNNYFYLKQKLGNPIYKDEINVNPYKYGFYTDEYLAIMKNPEIEFGKTHVKREVHIPVNPFIDFFDYNVIDK